MTLINNWRKAWKMASVQVAVLIAVLSAVQSALPQFGLPQHTFAAVNMMLGLAVVVARIISQPSVGGNQ